ncbi:hypothetical protein ALI144C_27365 [Actinosynnema sp. ALI-1.44]|uniref:serine hydrolase domain-containing protein n=1 Tax=Actinosynnema sp. ALI-1.44 TaxID=1933779 RepID=UPI00097BAFD9|nr:serine hydrolase domain-containing protein [Actinosynnema sp. ALI-1.44]ONI79513.1 hypothetical protein ALI144C_27365 [Actinosynnema sp. ALI-1.44]
MTHHAESSSPSRRSVLALMGAAPLVAGTTLATGATARADTESADGKVPREAVQAYDRYLAQRAAADNFSGTALLAYRGRPVLSKAYGLADRVRQVPNRMDTIYNLASASKPFTALAVVQLAQQGKLGLHEKLGTSLSGFPAELANQITVHQLLTHTSGMRGGPFDIHKVTHSKAEEWENTTSRTRKASLEFTPGTGWAYSNTGMDALGEIVATVSGQPFWDYVEQHIFTTAGMTDSAYCTRTQWESDPRIAHPHMLQADGTRIDGVRNLDAGTVLGAPGTNPARAFVGAGGGSGFSTAPDLLRFALALQQNKLLKPGFTQVFTCPKVPVPPPPNAPLDPSRLPFHGYGVTAGLLNFGRVIGHGGGIGGGNTNWSIHLDTDWVGIVLCNYDYADFQDILRQERLAITGTR